MTKKETGNPEFVLVLRRDIDQTNGLMPCGCGKSAVLSTKRHDTVWISKKDVKYSVKCPKNHVHTDWFDTELQAKNYWQRAMGGNIMKEQEEIK